MAGNCVLPTAFPWVLTQYTWNIVVTLAKSFVVVAWLHLRARALAFLLPCTGQMGIFADSQ